MDKGTITEMSTMVDSMHHMSFEGIKDAFKDLGYTLHNFEDYTNRGNENTYLAIMCQVKESDTGISAFHYEKARRDTNFQKMQSLRKGSFAIVRGRILEL